MTATVLAALPQGVRRLVPIVHFDIVGYSRMIGSDDAGTLARLRSLRASLLDPQIARHGGQVVQTAGDSLLVLFDSIRGAVRCAAIIQQRVGRHPVNDGHPAPIRFRVGVEIGDVIADRGDFHGEGVIVAVRLESACPPGAICVSRGVFDHIDRHLPVKATALGALDLKNVSRRIEAFALEVDPADDLDTDPAQPSADLSSFDELAAIAVLPFRCTDARDEAFTDGLTEGLIDTLAAWRSFPVISRHSTFVFRGRAVDVRTVGQQLGARYILSGSVSRRPPRVRVAVQLDDRETGTTLLSQSYEQEGEDGFEVQDEVVLAIAAVLLTARRRDDTATLRLPATEIETVVTDRLCQLLADQTAMFDALAHLSADPAMQKRLIDQAAHLAKTWPSLLPQQLRRIVMTLVQRVEAQDTDVRIEIMTSRLADVIGARPSEQPEEAPSKTNEDTHVLVVQIELTRIGYGTKLVVGEASRPAATPNPGVLRLVVKAHQVLHHLMDGSHASLASVAEAEGVTGSYLTRLVRIAWLAPDITQAILVGRQPPGLTPIKLMQSGVMPSDWQEQRVKLGFA